MPSLSLSGSVLPLSNRIIISHAPFGHSLTRNQMTGFGLTCAASDFLSVDDEDVCIVAAQPPRTKRVAKIRLFNCVVLVQCVAAIVRVGLIDRIPSLEARQAFGRVAPLNHGCRRPPGASEENLRGSSDIAHGAVLVDLDRFHGLRSWHSYATAACGSLAFNRRTMFCPSASQIS